MKFASVAVILATAAVFFLFSAARRSGGSKINSGQAAGFFWTACALAFVTAMVLQPEIVYEGASTGLKAWWNIVFPSLLPFFIASELLMSFGLVKFMGVLLEPVMRPLFNVPGCGSFVFCVGYTSGYPISAMVTARLRSMGLCTRIEAERLVSFTSNSSPLFMIVAVSVGMFGRPELAVVIAGSHYLANLTLGFFLRFYGRNDREKPPSAAAPVKNLPARALGELTKAWQAEKRPLGKIIGDAVRNSINNLLYIGGFIILFAVIIRLSAEIGLIGLLAQLFGVILLPLGLSPEVMPALASGFFEMTIGSKMASESAAPLVHQVAAAGIILGWGGLSALAQVAGMISETDIRMLPFVCARMAHAALAALYTAVFFGPAMPLASSLAVPAMAALDKMQESPPLLVSLQCSGVLLLAVAGMLVLSSIFTVLNKFKTRL
ncbi:MAG: sporulation integral membrane protein YlbJ [Peptococcaceae bacterium]|nr:sporulation integral membrane protein YlbJ [Peptococcaceae bacterium]